ncbi:restriction endonuclease subunit S [Salinisphaera sp. G21_0]|uniref:restriction endonuclease subunit S n=1 Tax=Salinisphaera sp. G21_0 TaxID=2821094 RepID=UPI001ADC91F2|nr:restriction endonuclease subunit S [Salinisphaera sp. G21_0]MBO9482281.1 restriction endonuclease subunit S [Salinisphaera sp. G21_0]
MNALITQNLSTLALAVQNKSASGRGSGKKIDLYGVKKLRELILELAVRGKLVAQNPEDEHATKLLEKIFTEKKRLIKEEGLKTKASEHISDEDQYLSVPDTWEYCRLGNLAKFIDYRGKTPIKLQAGIRLITAKNVRFGYISLQPEEFISEDEYDAWMTRGFPKMGDILFTPEAPLGNVAIIDIQEKFALAQRAICFQLHDPSTAPFLKILLMSPAFQKELENNATGMTATGIKASKLKEIPIPIPPLAEQHRIVAKVDELMALCDQIEQQTEASLSAHTTLVENMLATLTSSANAEELKQNWQRIASHFTTLFTTEVSIDQPDHPATGRDGQAGTPSPQRRTRRQTAGTHRRRKSPTGQRRQNQKAESAAADC